MRHIHQIAMTVLVAGAATVLQSCGSSRAEEEESKKAAAEASAGAAVVDAFPLKKEQLVSNIQIPGELIAYQQVDIYAKVSSFVKKTPRGCRQRSARRPAVGHDGGAGAYLAACYERVAPEIV